MLNVILIDGHGLLFRTINAAVYEQKRDYKFGPGLEVVEKGKVDLYSNWKKIFISSLFNCIQLFKPNKVVFAIDDRVSWRKKIYSNYKISRKLARKKSLIDFEEFYPIANEFISDLKDIMPYVEFVMCPECEGDDIIAVFSRIYKNENVTIISSDGDLNQLLTENVKQWDPIKKKEVKNINVNAFLEAKILMGDRGDDIPPIFPGIGPKTVLKHLKTPLDELLVTDQLKQNYLRNKKLITLTELPHEIESLVLSEHSKYSPETSKKNLMGFLVKHKLMSSSSDFSAMLRIMRSSDAN